MKLHVRLLIHKKLSKLEQGAAEALSYLKTENLPAHNLDVLKSKPALIRVGVFITSRCGLAMKPWRY
jgi:hypothetical protein